MGLNIINNILKSEAITYFCSVYNLDTFKLKAVPRHKGAANLVFHHRGSSNCYLRITFREDRNPEMIASELDFVNYLKSNGFPCAYPILSKNGNLFEEFPLEEKTLISTLFSEAKGKFLHQCDYRMPEGVTLSKFWQKNGELLGKLHALSSSYSSVKKSNRFNWLERHDQSLSNILPEKSDRLISLIKESIDKIRSVQTTNLNYGLTHNDIGIINYKIDYSNSDCNITLFDFDDCGYNYYMYDLACFWEYNTGWAMNIVPKDQWKQFMSQCYQTMIDEYHLHHQQGIDEIACLPLFLRAVHIENILESFHDMIKSGKKPKLNKKIKYHIYCLEHELDYLGFFDDIFNKETPFCL